MESAITSVLVWRTRANRERRWGLRIPDWSMEMTGG
jgi:hypothetical protein